MILTIFLFFIFIINFVIIVGTDSKFGVNLSKEAKKVYQQSMTVQAKRGTIYDRNGNPIAEDATTYSLYAIISKNYTTATGQKLYVQPSQYEKVASILENKLGMKKNLVLKQLNQKNCFKFPLEVQVQDCLIPRWLTSRKRWKSQISKELVFLPVRGVFIQMGYLLHNL